ncbi:hypothetical protein A2331_04845 [Candidatus Falkowbacteria bacterium RIFOXYB2_FULL_34_18]|uniref:Uncharacterized protein n=1 Tax=Candidatus Falkowbacteria bacterium RIFOXYD2_FULL_34_120 TaxID=1798007 RepID=A0A1F5TNH0_9BACT|nr:MAG: hypothetical protein A2331_04845 [Candidatus Falkowbacteria bacterium RIFOXYB2_FULL_34_18]OGF28852.1 MAG: hypothetical protein A2500_00530 [Candidatus Falkowbacteria bacterium RIFOXYC12_FULL_34_55]OGF35775.1 MAG: hypothetical protein A2466_04540 [Candidatus Falkowbacteria bacterium RIFOXYC2_FULL_34_220]OGF38441.1 MAG: hypothetical protein A2515_01980 [Candidatus Falkowbacteria bacterium RIFOXYD12_FULL_34_57]OGF40503.1 MAG: hypothetical protein A2531_02945 [Candidatus Falkowbacteria bact
MNLENADEIKPVMPKQKINPDNKEQQKSPDKLPPIRRLDKGKEKKYPTEGNNPETGKIFEDYG